MLYAPGKKYDSDNKRCNLYFNKKIIRFRTNVQKNQQECNNDCCDIRNHSHKRRTI